SRPARVARGERRICGVARAIASLLEPKRRKKLSLEERGVCLTGDLLDDHAEEDIARVVIEPLRTGREVEGVLVDERDDLARRQVVLPRPLPLANRRVAVNA